MTDVMNRLESKFDAWLAEFESRPIVTGIKVVLIFLVLRWIWRAVK